MAWQTAARWTEGRVILLLWQHRARGHPLVRPADPEGRCTSGGGRRRGVAEEEGRRRSGRPDIEGEWKAGKRHGTGISVTKSGERSVSAWDCGVRVAYAGDDVQQLNDRT